MVAIASLTPIATTTTTKHNKYDFEVLQSLFDVVYSNPTLVQAELRSWVNAFKLARASLDNCIYEVTYPTLQNASGRAVSTKVALLNSAEAAGVPPHLVRNTIEYKEAVLAGAPPDPDAGVGDVHRSVAEGRGEGEWPGRNVNQLAFAVSDYRTVLLQQKYGQKSFYPSEQWVGRMYSFVFGRGDFGQGYNQDSQDVTGYARWFDDEESCKAVRPTTEILAAPPGPDGDFIIPREALLQAITAKFWSAPRLAGAAWQALQAALGEEGAAAMRRKFVSSNSTIGKWLKDHVLFSRKVMVLERETANSLTSRQRRLKFAQELLLDVVDDDKVLLFTDAMPFYLVTDQDCGYAPVGTRCTTLTVPGSKMSYRTQVAMMVGFHMGLVASAVCCPEKDVKHKKYRGWCKNSYEDFQSHCLAELTTTIRANPDRWRQKKVVIYEDNCSDHGPAAAARDTWSAANAWQAFKQLCDELEIEFDAKRIPPISPQLNIVEYFNRFLRLAVNKSRRAKLYNKPMVVEAKHGEKIDTRIAVLVNFLAHALDRLHRLDQHRLVKRAKASVVCFLTSVIFNRGYLDFSKPMDIDKKSIDPQAGNIPAHEVLVNHLNAYEEQEPDQTASGPAQ